MSSRVASRVLGLVSLSLLGVLGMSSLLGCEFVIADWYYVDRPRAMGTSAEVVEFSPVWSSRIGFDPLDPPITEPLPGDRLRLAPLLVDGEGRAIDPADIDALWFQCGTDRCAAADGQLVAGLDTPCADLSDWTMDRSCKLGGGGAIEFIVPPVGQLTVFSRYGYYYMVAAVDGSRTAESCWAARQRQDQSLEGCVFADRELKVGPSWVLLVEAALAGLDQDIPVTEIPVAAFGQPANRVPVLGLIGLRRGDGQVVEVGPESGAIAVRAGETLAIVSPEWRPLHDLQVYFTARETMTPGAYVFMAGVETIWLEWYTSGSLVRIDQGDMPGAVELLVDELAEPGTVSRLIVLWGDDRGAEAMRVIELEVGE